MELKLNHRLPQTADRLAAFELGMETELRRRLQLTGSNGVVSADGQDIDNDAAPCALSINAQDPNAIDVAAGTVVFANGEFIDLLATDIQARAIDTTIEDGQVFRLEYGELDDGDLEANPFFNFAAQPKKRKKTPLEMLVVETVTAFNAQPADVKNRSIVIGVVRVEGGILEVDNGRDTYTFSRPWFSPQDVEHRSKVGTGQVTDNNIHGIALNDLTVGRYTAWQALVGRPPCVLARSNGFGRLPGEICSETIPSGSFATDATGLITGVGGALYAPLGFWPDRLLRISLSSSSTTQLAAWIPHGRNIIAVFDPENFAAPADVSVTYTKVTAGAFPGSLTGLQTLTVGQPTNNELIVAGGNFFEELVENKVLFTDVGLIPMKFDILVDNTGRAYKSPDVIYCNTLLDTIGSSPQAFTIQPSSPSRLRVAISNYVQGFTSVSLLITGTNESGGNISETVTFTGPGVLVQPSFTEVTALRQFTSNVFASVGQISATVRNGDGPNTTVTVFAEQVPQRPDTQDDLLLGSVQWTGSEVTALYSNDPDVAIDRRIVTTGGGSNGLSSIGAQLNQPMLVDTVGGFLPPGTTDWVTVVEDLNDPKYMEFPNDFVNVQTGTRPPELSSDSHGMRYGYISRVIPFGSSIDSATTVDAFWIRFLPTSNFASPVRVSHLSFTLTLLRVGAADQVFTGSFNVNPYPPYQALLTGPAISGSYYAAQLTFGNTPTDWSEVFQGFIFHMRA